MTFRIRHLRNLVAVVVSALVAGAAAAAVEPLADDRIESALRAELEATRGVPSDAIRVHVDEGIATLRGPVESILARERAVRVAKQMRGVLAVVDRIDVRPTERPDAEIRGDVIAALAEDPATDSWEIGVEVDGGAVRLTGRVDSYAERNLAGTVARAVRGVRDLDNAITVDWDTDRLDNEIQRDIEQRLRWDTRVESGLIDVAVDDGRVTLSGAVGSALERGEAMALAWVQGVRSVSADELEVRWWARDEMERREEGPKATDEEIRKAVERAFLYDPRVFSSNPQVEVENGIVTLHGGVDSLKAKKAAARDAKNTVGVWYVRNLLEVRKAPLVDDAIERNVRTALRRAPYVSQLDIRVSAVNGKVYLHGDVDSYFERAQAEDAASRAAGVVAVDNQIDVAYDALDYGVLDLYSYEPLLSPYGFDHATLRVKSDEEIEQEIQSEFFWSPFVDGESITVDVSDGRATLTGTVGSWPERMAATENALEGGAVEVLNELEIEGS